MVSGIYIPRDRTRGISFTTGIIVLAVLFFAAPGFLSRARAAAIGSEVSLAGGVYGQASAYSAFDGTNVWTLNPDGSLTKWGHYGPILNYSASSIGLQGTPPHPSAIMISANGNIWVGQAISGSSNSHGNIEEISPTGTVLLSVDLPSLDIPGGLVEDSSGNIWTENGNDTVSKISATGTLIGTYTVATGQIEAIAYDGTNIWTTGSSDLTEVSPAGTVMRAVSFGTTDDSYAVAFDGTNIWATYANYLNNADNGLKVVSPSTGAVIATYTGSSGVIPSFLAFDGTNMWAMNATGGAWAVSPSGTITTYPGDTGGNIVYNSADKTIWTFARYAAVGVIQTTATASSDSSLSGLSVPPGTLNPTFSNATTSYILSVLPSASSVAVTATTNYPQASLSINSSPATTTVPYTVSGLYDGETISLRVTAWDYTYTDYSIDIAATPSADTTLDFSSTDGPVQCPSTTPVDCELDITSTDSSTAMDFTPTLAVSGGTMTINGTPWTSSASYTDSLSAANNNTYTINVTGADASTSTYNLIVTDDYPDLSEANQYTSSANTNENISLVTDGTNAWFGDNQNNATEVTPSGTITDYPYNGPDAGAGLNGMAFDGTNVWSVDYDGGVNELTPGGTWTTYSSSTYSDGFHGMALDKNGNVWTTFQDNSDAIEIAPDGTVLGDFPTAGTAAGDSYGANSMAYDGTNMWAVDDESGLITELSPAGTILATTSIGLSADPLAIAFDGTNMWTANNNDTVSEISPSGAILNTYALPSGSEPSAIAFDGANMWVGNYGKGTVTEISLAGVMKNYYILPTTTFQPGALAFASTTGMMWALGSRGQGVVEFPLNQGGVPATTYAITVTQGAHGTIAPGTVSGIASGTSETFTITPASGYQINSVTVDSSSVGSVSSYDFPSVTADHTITASFSAIPSGSTLSISPTTLPDGTVSSGYSQVLTETGTTGGTFTWSISSGSLPGGISLDTSSAGATTTLSGTPSANGTFNFTVQVVNGASSGTQALSLTVNAASGGGAAGGGSTSIIVGVGAGGTYITPTSTPSSTVELKALISSLEAQLKLLLQQAAARSIIVPAGTSSSTLIFTKNLTLGSSGPDVAALQRYLNTHGFPVVTTPGFAGSLGYETQHFGVSTQTAVAKLQKSVGIVPISGFFGPITRAWVNTHQQQ